MNFYCSPLPSVIGDVLGLSTLVTKNGWYVSLDKGWDINDNQAFKGTSTSWCRIDWSDGFRVETNALRDFPIHYHKTCVSNVMNHTPLLPCDGNVHWTGQDICLQWDKNFYPDIPKNRQLTFDECTNLLFDTLCESVESFVKKNTKKIFLPIQNGIDTLTVRSIFDYLNLEYNLFDLPKVPPKYTHLHKKLKTDHWGFSQVMEIENSVVVTGFNGDEWILRNPFYVNMLLSNRGISLYDTFEKIENCYMKSYWEQNYKEKCSYRNNTNVKEIMTMMCNDYQIWHLNTTFFFSPLKNRRLLGLLAADSETVIDQITDARLSKAIIQKCNPALICKIENTKNQNDPYYFW